MTYVQDIDDAGECVKLRYPYPLPPLHTTSLPQTWLHTLNLIILNMEHLPCAPAYGKLYYQVEIIKLLATCLKYRV